MKINKLLFFLFALIGFNSCVEYVDNGKLVEGPVLPEEQKYTAKQANPQDAKYVGDVFEFEAMLNTINVTSATKFKVNGTEIKGNTYTPHRVGSHSVIATMDNFTANFKFTVLEKGDEPTNNRIEYDGKTYPLTHTDWTVDVDKDTDLPIVYDNVGVPGKFTRWGLRSMDDPSFPMAANGIWIHVYVPVDQNEDPQNVHEVDVQELHFYNSAIVKIDGSLTTTFNPLDNGYPILNFISVNGQNANYTIEIKAGNETAKLYWSGPYTVSKNTQ